MNIQDKVAIVTGASKGIGKVTALELAKLGANLVLAARTGPLLHELAETVSENGVEALALPTDMTREEEIKNLVDKALDRFGRIDILVNNAGLGYFHPVADFPTNDWDEMFSLNLRGLFILTRECIPALRKAGESVVVNVASLAGKNAFVNGGGYAATKHALIGFSRCLMLEERKNGMRVLVICPGSVDTQFFDDRAEDFDSKRPRMLKPEDVASSIVHMIQLPQRAMVSEIDIRPSNP